MDIHYDMNPLSSENSQEMVTFFDLRVDTNLHVYIVVLHEPCVLIDGCNAAYTGRTELRVLVVLSLNSQGLKLAGKNLASC